MKYLSSRIFESDIKYLDNRKITIYNLYKIVIKSGIDILYVNSIFDFRLSIFPIIVGKILRKRIIVAPRGELCKNAINIKKYKKYLFLLILKYSSLLNNCEWHATSEEEVTAISGYFKTDKISLIENISSVTKYNYDSANIYKKIGEIRLVFISRICKKKGLMHILDLLKELKGKIILDIYGPIEDQKYYQKFINLSKDIGDYVHIVYCGAIENDLVKKVIKNYHFLILLSESENYGHVIAESIDCIVPPIISNNTPWNDIEDYECGYIFKLDNLKAQKSKMQEIIDMNNDKYNLIRENLIKYKKVKFNNNELIQKYRSMFNGIK